MAIDIANGLDMAITFDSDMVNIIDCWKICRFILCLHTVPFCIELHCSFMSDLFKTSSFRFDSLFLCWCTFAFSAFFVQLVNIVSTLIIRIADVDSLGMRLSSSVGVFIITTDDWDTAMEVCLAVGSVVGCKLEISRVLLLFCRFEWLIS
jgi:hypothetical protein